MPVWMISLLFGVGISGFVFAKLVRANGNPNPSVNFIAAIFAGLMAFIVLFTFLKYVLNF